LGQRTVALKGAFTLAVLPKTPGAKLLAREGFLSGKEIMLHAPMSNHQQLKLGPGALTEHMDKKHFIEMLNSDINDIPHIRGVNNHMGSLLTTLSEQMTWVMQTLSQRNLYFIDSLTDGNSVAFTTARKYGLKTLERDVFLDHSIDTKTIERQFQRLMHKAKTNGYAIAIGHPYPETLDVLERLTPQLAEQGIELVHISTLIQFSNDQDARQKNAASSNSASNKQKIKQSPTAL
jgi:hypothetical protein